jgi:NAD(P)-dependent dehydrogenase (short-subunit alcohol dehydrogenase family)
MKKQIKHMKPITQMKLIAGSKKILVITGATSGIGLETIKALAHTHEIYFLARNPDKARQVCQLISQATYIPCDISDLHSIELACAQLRLLVTHIDVLIHNAGILEKTFKTSAQDIELTFATNHLGPFYLQQQLEPLLSSSARVIVVSSYAHTMASVDLTDIELKKSYSGWRQYANTKLYNILFTRILAKKLANRSITVNCLHPGVVLTHLFDRFSGFANQPLLKNLLSLFFLTPVQGAKTTLFLATHPSVQSITGQYFNKCKQTKTSKLAQDLVLAQQLWSISESYVTNYRACKKHKKPQSR